MPFVISINSFTHKHIKAMVNRLICAYICITNLIKNGVHTYDLLEPIKYKYNRAH